MQICAYWGFSKYTGKGTVFPMQIGSFLCVFGVPKKRHIQRKRYDLRRNGTLWIWLKEIRDLIFWLKELGSARIFQFFVFRSDGVIDGISILRLLC